MVLSRSFKPEAQRHTAYETHEDDTSAEMDTDCGPPEAFLDGYGVFQFAPLTREGLFWGDWIDWAVDETETPQAAQRLTALDNFPAGMTALALSGHVCNDTLIATVSGNRSVQDLCPGDQLLTVTGGVTTIRHIRRIQITKDSAPIRIEADALDDGKPCRDLTVSPDQAIEIEGILYNAKALVNDTTIHQMPFEPDTQTCYFTIDTGAHELIFAEGCRTETHFSVPVDHVDLPPQTAPAELAQLRVSFARLVPAFLHRRLMMRANIPPMTETAA